MDTMPVVRRTPVRRISGIAKYGRQCRGQRCGKAVGFGANGKINGCYDLLFHYGFPPYFCRVLSSHLQMKLPDKAVIGNFILVLGPGDQFADVVTDIRSCQRQHLFFSALPEPNARYISMPAWHTASKCAVASAYSGCFAECCLKYFAALFRPSVIQSTASHWHRLSHLSASGLSIAHQMRHGKCASTSDSVKA